MPPRGWPTSLERRGGSTGAPKPMPASALPSLPRKRSPGSARRRALTALCTLLASSLLAGCTTLTRPPSQVDRLIAHPEFNYAAQAAPRFTSDALQAIADLEARK